MMSKIRDLINKFKVKLKKSADDDEEYIEINDSEIDEQGFEDELNDELDNELDGELDEILDDDDILEDDFLEDEFDDSELEADIEEHDDLPTNEETLDNEELEPIMVQNNEDKTADVPIINNQDDEVTADVPIMQKNSNTSEIQVVQENDIDFAEDYDRDEYIEEELTNSKIEDAIDLDNSRLSLKDRLSFAKQSLKDKLNRFNRKKFQQLTIDDSKKNEEDKRIINKRHKQFIDSFDKIKVVANKIDWKNIHKDFFDENKRNPIHRIFQGAIIFMSVFVLGKNTALLLKGADDNSNIANVQINIDDSKLLTSDDINNIKLAKVFKTDTQKKNDSKKPIINTVAKCEQASQKSSLPITLINTIVLQDSIKSIASVQVRSSSKPNSLREGDEIQGLAELSKIDRMKIIIKNLSSGGCEYVETEKKAGTKSRSPIAVMSAAQSKAFTQRKKKVDGIENDGNEFTIEKSFLQEKLKDINSILTQARGIQLTNPDGSLSFKIVEIQPGSVFSYLGIQNNDIITEIGGNKINDLNQVMSLFGKISNLDKLNLKVKRNGDEVPLNYKFR